MGKKVYLNGYIDVPVERIHAVSAALIDHIVATRAEDGCLKFDVSPSPDVKGRFMVDEIFIDKASFEEHQTRTKASPWAIVTDGLERNYTITEHN